MSKLQELIDNLYLEIGELSKRRVGIVEDLKVLKEKYLCNKNIPFVELDTLRNEIIKKEEELNKIDSVSDEKRYEFKNIIEGINKCTEFNLLMIGDILAEYITKISKKHYVCKQASHFILDDNTSSTLRSEYQYVCIRDKKSIIIISEDKVQIEPYMAYVDSKKFMIKDRETDYGWCRKRDILLGCIVDKFNDLKKSGDICDFYPRYFDFDYDNSLISGKKIEEEVYDAYFEFSFDFYHHILKPKNKINIYSDEINSFIAYLIEERYRRQLFELSDISIEILREMLDKYLRENCKLTD